MPTCEKCNDKGAYGRREPVQEIRVGESVLASGPAYITELCACRKSLPPRDGVAKWWSIERIHSVVVSIPIFDEKVSINVDAEVPISQDNFRVHRRGNRHYPSLIEIECPKSMSLQACTARDLARALIAAAEATEMIDDADTDPHCGHWAPCDCEIAKTVQG